MSIDDAGDGEYVRALARGLAVIECFEGECWPISLAEVARRTNLARGTARRILLTLQKLGYVDSTNGRFFLRSRVLRLGHAYLSSSITTTAEEVLRGLADKVVESCSLAELDGDEIVYVARSSSRRLVKDYVEIGRRMPAYPTSMGRVLLAGLEDDALDAYLARADIRQLAPRTITDRAQLKNIIVSARANGWATSDEEIEPGRRAIAVSVRNGSGRTIAALNISAMAARHSCEEMEKFLDVMRDAAADLSRMMIWSGDRSV